ncbi:MAG: hypothetical protein JW990_19530, partial [Thermoleophilia bacterium]|nr:hypothetical protein [Thermoleophilia bacterium]
AVDHTVNKVWKPTEMEKAFRVYENGAEGGWWGYSVDAGDFEQLSSHMRGLGAKIRYDYVQSYCDARGLDPGDLTEDEWNAIGDEGIEHVKRQFDERIARKADIAKIQADTLDLMELFREKGLLERGYSNPMYSGHDDLEMLMNRLGNMVETVKRDAGRFELVDVTDYDVADPKDRDGLLPRQWVADLIFEWYNNGQEAYQAKLAELGLVDLSTPSAATVEGGHWQLAETRIDSADYAQEFTGCGSPITWADEDKKLFASFNTSIRVAVAANSLEMYYETVDCYDTDEGPYPSSANLYAKKCEWTPFPDKIVPGETYRITVRAYVTADGGTNAINGKVANFSIQDLLGDVTGASGAGEGVSVTAPVLAKGEQAAGKETVEVFEISLGVSQDPGAIGVFRARVSSGASPGAWGEILYIYKWVEPAGASGA